MAKPVRSPEGKAFVAETMRIVGAKTPRELSRKLGYFGTDREGRLYAWARGESAPNHEGTIDMLRISGRLRETPELGEVGRAPGSAPIRQGDIGEVVAALSKEMRAGFRKIDRRLQGLEQPHTAVGAQPQSKAGQA